MLKGENTVVANALTISRIILSLALLVPPALSPAFLALYAIAGVTDMLDGFVARTTNTASDLGAKLDSIADLVFAIVCLARILPAITVPIWLWAWVALIALLKVTNVASGYVMERRLVMPHTVANKVAGFVAYLVPFALPYVGVIIPAIPACAVATFAAIQEGHLIRTGKSSQPFTASCPMRICTVRRLSIGKVPEASLTMLPRLLRRRR